LTADEVTNSRGRYDPRWHYQNEPETRAALDLIFADHFSRNEPGLFKPIRDALLTGGDYFMHLADLSAYAETQAAVGRAYRDTENWTRKSIINVGCSGKFSSDRTIAEYTADIWKAKPVQVK
jgi:starch phosphorylase